MRFTPQQKREAYKKLSLEVQNFVMDNETTELISNLLTKSGFSEEQSINADGEILYAMYDLQTAFEALSNIAKLSNKNIADLSELKDNLDSQIFSEIAKLQTKNINKNNEEKYMKESQNGVGGDFEQIILNQAKAMQPAVASPKIDYGVAEPAVDEQRRETPSNLPTVEQQTEEKPKAIHNYVGENDPYREPLE